MKFPYSMLLDFVQTDLDADQAGDLLTMAGFELEGIEEVEGEKVLDIKVMSNRGDGLSVFGLAREVLAKRPEAKPTELYLRASRRFADAPKTTAPNPAAVAIETSDCARYACRLFEGVANADAPEWIQSRLRKAGMRPISLLVDLTNYVLLELGQPLHAFDYKTLKGGRIVVRKAQQGEKITTLNGDEHELRPDQMMICDAEHPVAVAGVMGGLETEVTESTTRVLLESAQFLNTSIRRTRKQLGLNTEASYRFERSVDPDGVVAAIERFTELLGLPGSETVDAYPGQSEPSRLHLRVSRARLLLGMEIEQEQAVGYLRRLGMEVESEGDNLYVVPPSWRPDIVREIDLVEELGRVHGYERIPERLPSGASTLGGPQGELLQEDRMREAAVRVGFVQIVSHSLRAAHALDFSDQNRIGPRNPGSPETALLRDSLLPGLCEAAQRNGGRNMHLFEIGKVFSSASEARYVERKNIAFLSNGELLPPARKGEVVPQSDFFSLKGALESSVGEAGVQLEFCGDSADPRLHPTRQATLLTGGRAVGVMGQIHPELASALKIPAASFLAELDVESVLAFGAHGPSWKPISRNPAVGRDLSLLVDKSVPYSEIESAIADAAGDLLERQWLFDVFEGTGIPEGKHSLGIGLQFRKFGANFTDEEANLVREKVVAALVELGATMR